LIKEFFGMKEGKELDKEEEEDHKDIRNDSSED